MPPFFTTCWRRQGRFRAIYCLANRDCLCAGINRVAASAYSAAASRPRTVIQFIPHGPGPPHRPHIPGSAAADPFAVSDATAKTLSVRAVFFSPHVGHATGSVLLIDLTSRSNLALQDGHEYS
jgi:hypothetical protein